jgi:hypothetical protein
MEISFLGFITFAAYYLILKALITVIVARWPESVMGEALAALS